MTRQQFLNRFHIFRAYRISSKGAIDADLIATIFHLKLSVRGLTDNFKGTAKETIQLLYQFLPFIFYARSEASKVATRWTPGAAPRSGG